MTKIDLHTHILPKRLPDLSQTYGYPGWISTHIHEGGKTASMMLDGKHFREISCNCWDPEVRLQECSDSKVDVQVLSTIPVLFNYWAKPEHTLDLARYLNDDLAQTVSSFPGKFIGLATLPMQAPDLAVKELYRCINELGLSGIQIGSHINDWNLDERCLDPVWEACEALDVPIFVHPWDMQQDKRMSKYWFPWLIGMPTETTVGICSILLGGVLERFPKLKFCFAHGGGSFPFTLGRIEHGFHVRPDLVQTDTQIPPSAYKGKIWTDSLVHDHDALDLLIKKIGVDRIILGTDYPFPLGELEPGKLIESSDLSQEDKDKLLWKNCLEFFGDKVKLNLL